jgi:hypothetical protein
MASSSTNKIKGESATGGIINAPAAPVPQSPVSGKPQELAKLENGNPGRREQYLREHEQRPPLHRKAMRSEALSDLSRPATAAAPATIAGAVAAAVSNARSPATFETATRASAIVESADRLASWRLGPAGAIARHDANDANGLWQPQSSGVSVDLLAGSAPSATVCWIVGRAGTIVRTLDGANWQRVSSPTQSDIVGVAAQSAEIATITDADGRRFASSDGGATWNPVPLPPAP